MIYDVDYFISKFQAIPEDKWTVGLFSSGDAHCAYGHCGLHGCGPDTAESYALGKVFLNIKPTVIDVNDSKSKQYPQATPKQRILAALYDIRMLSKGQEVQECDATKTSKETEAGTKIIHHYHKVTVPESIETKELILS